MTDTPIRVLIADDNAIVRMGLSSMLGLAPGIEVVGEARDGSEAIERARTLEPDVVLCDVRMPVMDGLDVARQIAGTTTVLMLTNTEDPAVIRDVMASGAKGYLVYGERQPDEIVAAVIAAAGGSVVLDPIAAATLLSGGPATGASTTTAPALRAALSEREAEVMDRVAEGLSNRDVARACFLAEKTVKNHLNRIFPKLGVSTRAEAIALWLRAAPPSQVPHE